MRLWIKLILFLPFICIWACASAESRDQTGDGSLYASADKLSYQDRISGRTNTVLKTPEGYTTGKPEVIQFVDDYFDCALYAKNFAQGNAVYGEFVLKGRGLAAENAGFTLKGEKVPLTATTWGYRCIAAIHPEQKPGRMDGVFTYTADGKTKSIRVTVSVKDVEYTISKKKLDLGRFSDESYYKDPEKKKFILECEHIREQAFKSDTGDSITNSISHPRDFHRITGAYWNKRIYLSYKKKKRNKPVKSKSRISFHRGVDLKGDFGAPVYAMADGVVVLSHLMFFEGNMVVVDHGNKVFSYYMHMESRGVKEGDRVKAGQQIGKVGSTGTSTGPHLHVALSIRGVHVDPLSFLWLPVTR
ncbi:MAG TPA: M23 family metallopeptidase [Spirochaetota bacterium]|nr:M23 family metallopeptidase [Spirochaetota bacterium]